MSSGSADHDDEGYVVKMRGLPWSTTVDEIMKFFGDCSISNGKNGVHMTMSREGRPSGEAYVEMDTPEDIEKACKRDRDHMGHRYIEVFKAKRGEMEWVVKRSGLNLENAMDDGCVRLRGLPFGCSKEEIAQFFSGLEILPNGISLPTDYTGRSTGEAYVQFVNKDVAERALQKHKEKIGHRYIEIFRSSLSEVRASIGPKMRGGPMGGFNQRPAPYTRGDRFGGMNRFSNNGRGSRNRDFDNGPWGSGNNYGSRGGNMGIRGGMDIKGGNYRGNNDSWGSNSGVHSIHMRGLPFKATEQDIADFFRPIEPVNVRIILENGGRPSGEADVEFATHEEAVKAMCKDKSHMSHRYIELFLNSTGGSSGMSLSGIGNFCGPKGNSMKRLQEETMCKMAVLGRGSMKDRQKEEECRTSLDPKYAHLSDDLHVEITAIAPPAEAHARIAFALAEVRKYLIPDNNDNIRQEQMREMEMSGPDDPISDDRRSSMRGSSGPASGGPGALRPSARPTLSRTSRPILPPPPTSRGPPRPPKSKVISILDRARAAMDQNYGYETQTPPPTNRVGSHHDYDFHGSSSSSARYGSSGGGDRHYPSSSGYSTYEYDDDSAPHSSHDYYESSDYPAQQSMKFAEDSSSRAWKSYKTTTSGTAPRYRTTPYTRPSNLVANPLVGNLPNARRPMMPAMQKPINERNRP